MLDKASLKLGLDRAVLQSMSGNKEGNNNGVRKRKSVIFLDAKSFLAVQQFSKKEIEDLLRKGAYAAIMDENDEGNRFCEEDIDQILQRRATTIMFLAALATCSFSYTPTKGPACEDCGYSPSGPMQLEPSEDNGKSLYCLAH
ncbi:hypothetical protein F7725_017666 [Dissostichus mawsoni]|uniref:Uncharacterized protein n=1 Tax=Dissostichus mawsoni TaxID=36200 RepID=A0A7J5Z5Y2_DISMA|nr:hypothetical protein F7725_017666 [Dissostichus mawsoni]